MSNTTHQPAGAAYTIRPATMGDAPAIGAVHCHGWQTAYAGLLPDAMLRGMSVEKSAALFAREGCRDMLVAEQGGQIIGFCGYGLWRDDPDDAGREGEVVGLYVRPDCQRQGIGAALMRAALDMLAARGCTAVSLWVLRGNDKAIRFYTHQGFARTGQDKASGPWPIVEHRLRRPLP